MSISRTPITFNKDFYQVTLADLIPVIESIYNDFIQEDNLLKLCKDKTTPEILKNYHTEKKRHWLGFAKKMSISCSIML